MLWIYALWGLFGSFAVEGLEFAGAIHRTGGWPWLQKGEPARLPMLASVIIRLAIGAGLTTAVAASHQISGAFGAVTIGAGAPLIFEQMLRHTGSVADPAQRTATHIPLGATPSTDRREVSVPHSAPPVKEKS